MKLGHHIMVYESRVRFGYGNVRFRCADCDLRGSVRTKPAGLAETFAADIMAMHYRETGDC